jgi:hypothetical protein
MKILKLRNFQKMQKKVFVFTFWKSNALLEMKMCHLKIYSNQLQLSEVSLSKTWNDTFSSLTGHLASRAITVGLNKDLYKQLLSVLMRISVTVGSL